MDDVTNAYWEKRGLVISDWYFSEGIETNSAGEKVKKVFPISFPSFLSQLLYLTSQFSNCMQKPVTSVHLSWGFRFKNPDLHYLKFKENCVKCLNWEYLCDPTKSWEWKHHWNVVAVLISSPCFQLPWHPLAHKSPTSWSRCTRTVLDHPWGQWVCFLAELLWLGTFQWFVPWSEPRQGKWRQGCSTHKDQQSHWKGKPGKKNILLVAWE